MENVSLTKRFVAEFVGTAFLLAAIVGSGIMAERLAGGNIAIALLANSIAVGGALVALILTFGQISGAHFNPVVTMCDAVVGGTSWRAVPAYLAAQISGAILGTGLANAMFDLPLFAFSTKPRTGFSQTLSEFVATFGLMAVVFFCARLTKKFVPFAVAAYIVSAFWFTASTSFANPAVTLARSLTDTFTGIRPADVPMFVIAEFAGAIAAVMLFRSLAGKEEI